MNSKQIQFNRQWLASLLLAGVILAATAGQTWADVSPSHANSTSLNGSGFHHRFFEGNHAKH